MNSRQRVYALAALILLFFTQVYSQQTNSSATGTTAQSLLGRWDLTLKAPDREYPSWLEISQENGQLKARMVSRWGHARALPKFELSPGGAITFVSPKEEEYRKDDMVFQGKLAGKTLEGTTTGQDGTPWKWTAVMAPSLKRASEPKWGKPRTLFNGKDLSGWTASDSKSTKAWTVENGTLVSPAK